MEDPLLTITSRSPYSVASQRLFCPKRYLRDCKKSVSQYTIKKGIGFIEYYESYPFLFNPRIVLLSRRLRGKGVGFCRVREKN